MIMDIAQNLFLRELKLNTMPANVQLIHLYITYFWHIYSVSVALLGNIKHQMHYMLREVTLCDLHEWVM